MEGYVYAMYNPSFTTSNNQIVLKVGKTSRHPEYRAQELFNTSVPNPFQIVWYRYVDDMDYVERRMHEHMADRRINSSREFFWVPKKYYGTYLNYIFGVVQALPFLEYHDATGFEKMFNALHGYLKLLNTVDEPLSDKDYEMVELIHEVCQEYSSKPVKD